VVRRWTISTNSITCLPVHAHARLPSTWANACRDGPPSDHVRDRAPSPSGPSTTCKRSSARGFGATRHLHQFCCSIFYMRCGESPVTPRRSRAATPCLLTAPLFDGGAAEHASSTNTRPCRPKLHCPSSGPRPRCDTRSQIYKVRFRSSHLHNHNFQISALALCSLFRHDAMLPHRRRLQIGSAWAEHVRASNTLTTSRSRAPTAGASLASLRLACLSLAFLVGKWVAMEADPAMARTELVQRQHKCDVRLCQGKMIQELVCNEAVY
jgi:hypothetical protein